MIEQNIPDELPNDRSDTRSDARVDDRSVPHPHYRMVPHIPDLIQPEEYEQHPQGRLVRISISSDGNGVQLIGDAFRPELLERLLESLGPDDIEQMLCG
ncbi:radical SAM-modified peptide, FtsH ternary system-associated [Streptomyces sp. YIM S03343]